MAGTRVAACVIVHSDPAPGSSDMTAPASITGRQSSAARGLLRMTQKEVCKEIGISPSTLANFETGLRALKSEHAQKLTLLYISLGLSFISGRAEGVLLGPAGG